MQNRRIVLCYYDVYFVVPVLWSYVQTAYPDTVDDPAYIAWAALRAGKFRWRTPLIDYSTVDRVKYGNGRSGTYRDVW